MLIGRRLVLVAFALVAIAIPSASQGSARLDSPVWVTARYAGVLDESFVYNPSRPEVWQSTLHFTFSESETARINPDGTVVRGKPTIGIGGRIRATYAPPNNEKSCTGTFSLRKNAPDPFLIGDSSATATLPTGPDYVKSSSDVHECSAVGVSGAPFESPHDVEFGKAVIAHCDVSQSPCTFAIDSKSKSATNSSSFRGTLTVTRSSQGPPGSPRPPGRQPVTEARVQAKRNALDALRPSLTSATYPCLVAAAGTSSLIVPATTIVGGVMLSASAPLCAQWVRTVYDEVRTIHDPPRRDYDMVAHITPVVARASLPPCSQFGSAQLALCKRVEAAAAAYLKAVGRVASASTAIRTTVERDTAAAKAGKSGAVAKQEQALKRLQGKLSAAQAARRSAGAAFAVALRAAKATIKLSKSQAAKGLDGVTAKVKMLGLDQATLSSVAGSRLAPRPIDVIAALGA